MCVYACVLYFQILNYISEILTNTRAPLRLHRQRPKEISETVEFDGLLSTLEMWAEQMESLKVWADCLPPPTNSQSKLLFFLLAG